MKNILDIIGLPLLSIHGAYELGRIKDVLIDPEEGKVKYFLIMDKKWYLGAKVVSFDNILSIGSHAITINDKDDLKKFCEVEDALVLAERDIEVHNAKVFTGDGQYMGTVKEYYMSISDGSISKCLLEGAKGQVTMDQPKIISFGRGVLIVQEFVGAEGAEMTPQTGLEGSKSGQDNIKKDTESSVRLFEEKQRQFLLGRRGTRTVLDGSGNILLEEGQTITSEILDRVDDKNKIIELTINTN